MELEKMMIEYILKNMGELNVVSLKVTLENALALVNGLSPWDAEKALKILFGGFADAE